MKEMGGLRKYLPITAATFGVGWLAISGIPPLAGFWSKDAVLSSAWQMNKILWAIGVFTAGLTAYYMSRQFALVFTGQARWNEARPAAMPNHGAGGAGGAGGAEAGEAGTGLPAPAHAQDRPRDPTWTMSVPLVVLAIAAVLGGGINFPAWHMDFLSRFLGPLFPTATAITISTGTKWALSVVTTAVALTGLALGLSVWKTAVHPRLEPSFLRRAWYFDDLVSAVVSGPLRLAAAGLAFVIDRRVVDGLVNGTARALGLSGRALRRLQNGYLRTYALGIGVGLVVLLAYLTFRVGN
jgi:NADH-quinone oxidoreductase subunit L